MIHTSKQLKDKVRNISKGDNYVAKTLIRNYMMERLLERISLSEYRDHFILKGGMLIASFIGVDMRATMDIDTTVKALPVNENDVQKVVSHICEIPLDDGVRFRISSVTRILEDFEYPGIRMRMEAVLDRMKQVIKLDISTDDVITPGAIEYEYKLLFEDRVISLLTYNRETLLAEKVQTILTRGIASTRLRDYYDVYSIMKMQTDEVDKALLREAFNATCRKRESILSKEEMTETLIQIKDDAGMAQMWERFREKNYYVGDLDWESVLSVVLRVISTYIIEESGVSNSQVA